MRRPGRGRPPAAVAAAAAAVAAATLLAACGVSGERSPRFVEDDRVPFGLLDSTTTTEGAPGTQGRPAVADVCLVVGAEGRLATVERAVPRRPTPADTLAALAGGPTAEEADYGLSTALPEDAFGDEAVASGGVVTVDLDPVFTDTDGRRQLLAVAQVVCTLTARPGVGQVAFTLDGELVEVPRGDGTATSGPVARDDYARLLPR